MVMTLDERVEALENKVKELESENIILRNRDFKQNPMKARRLELGEMSVPHYYCPICNYLLAYGDDSSRITNYCPECGQKIEGWKWM